MTTDEMKGQVLGQRASNAMLAAWPKRAEPDPGDSPRPTDRSTPAKKTPMNKLLAFLLFALLAVAGIGSLAAFVGVTHTVALDTPSGVQEVTPDSMSGVIVGRTFTCGGFHNGNRSVEYCTPTAVTATTFTASFANYHDGQWTFTNDPRLAAAMWGT